MSDKETSGSAKARKGKKVVDYQELAGKKKTGDKMATGESAQKSSNSIKSARSKKSNVSSREGDFLGEDAILDISRGREKYLEDLEAVVEKGEGETSGAYSALLYEQRRHGEGSLLYLEEENIPEDLHQDKQWSEVKKTYVEEHKCLELISVAMKRRTEIEQLRGKIIALRVDLESEQIKQSLCEKRNRLVQQEKVLALKEEEEQFNLRLKKQEERFDRIHEGKGRDDSVNEWVRNSVGQRERMSEARLEAPLQLPTGGRSKEQAQRGIHHLQRVGLLTTELADKFGTMSGGVDKSLGQGKTESWQGFLMDEDLEGKTKQDSRVTPTLDGDERGKEKEKEKIKSGKFAKDHIGLVRQEAWPHLSVLKKYAKRVAFDQMDFERFVAGETRIIASMEGERAKGRLRLLSLMAHWMCKSRDWPTLRNLYDGIVESIELGETDWTSDFSHYETMIPSTPTGSDKLEKGKIEGKTDDKVKKEVYWCKDYQRGECTQQSPHMAQLKPDEKPVPVLHICALCWQKNKKRKEHPESDGACPAKK